MKALRLIAAVLLATAALQCDAQEQPISQTDDIRISLLTCSPYEAIYALYGHTAIRIEDASEGIDMVVNYGVFSFEKPHFVLRFVFGLTDYEMGIESFDHLLTKYHHYHCSIIQQELDLSAEEKELILTAMAINYLPDNRVYRYNCFYDNCTTRARDIIASNLRGHIDYDKGPDFAGPSLRDIVHSCNNHRPWVRFGKDLLMGVAADRPTTLTEYQFLPANLMSDFDGAYVIGDDGTVRRLVKDKTTVLEGGLQQKETEFPLRPVACAAIILALSLALTVTERITRHPAATTVAIVFDALMMTACGLVGIVLFAMLFSQHPTVRVNLQLLLLNPLPLFLVYSMVRHSHRGQQHWQHYLWSALIILFLLGNFEQSYAEGINLLALALLIRQVARLPLSLTTHKP